jgi:hypothetical protein
MRYRVLVLTLACGILSGCASSRPSGAGADAAEDGATGGDGATVDSAEPDGASPDGAGPDALVSVDANIIDATVIDGAVTPIDAAVPVDAAVPIDANGCATQPCSLAPQCGCTAPLTCDIDFTDLMGTACRAVNVPGTETSTCTTFSECAAGYVCAGGHCLKYCANDASCPQPRGLCAIQITDGMGAAIPGAVTCSSNCDPTNSAGGACDGARHHLHRLRDAADDRRHRVRRLRAVASAHRTRVAARNSRARSAVRRHALQR